MTRLRSFIFTSKLKSPNHRFVFAAYIASVIATKASLPTSRSFHHNDFARRIHSTMADDAAREDALLDVEDKVQDKHSKPRGGKGRGRGGGGGGQGREVQVSKALSRLLRHQAANAGIQLDDEGFARLDAVVSERFLNRVFERAALFFLRTRNLR
jgi:hypothetical protein